MIVMNVYNSTTDGWDISELVHDIEYTTSILGQAGKLTFTVEKDSNLNSQLQMNVGSLVEFYHGEGKELHKVFKGNIFTIGTNKDENYKVVAYDMLRYWQNHENIAIPDGENDLMYYFQKFCADYEFKQYKIVNWDKFINTHKKISGNNFVDVSTFEIMQYCMDDFSLENSLQIPSINYNRLLKKGDYFIPKFYLRDNFGQLELREIITDLFYNDDGSEKNEFLIIGDESLLTNYEYEVDIDKNTYNEFYFMYNENNGSKGKTNQQTEKQSMVLALQAGIPISGTNTTLDGTTVGKNTIPKWGKLRKIVTINTSKLDIEARLYINELVNLHNQPTRTLKLTALGYDGIYAGNSFIFSLSKLKINYPVYVLSATHRYSESGHTMELEVNTNPSMEVFSK